MRYQFLWTVVFLLSAQFVTAQLTPTSASSRIELPVPTRTGGMSLNEALATRRSIRTFQPVKLTMQEISQLLWAAQGITDDKGRRTAPSAHAQYFLHVYIALPDGFFEYVPAGHALQKLSGNDIRATLSTQETVKAAPAVILIAGEYDRAVKLAEHDTALRLVNLEAGHATQNVLLEATALKLAATPVGGIDPKQTAQAASLPAAITPIYLVPIGHAK